MTKSSQYFDAVYFDTNGEETTISRAKSYVITRKFKGDKEPEYVIGIFSKVSARAAEKEFEMMDALLARDTGELDAPRVDASSYEAYKEQEKVFEEVSESFLEILDEEDEDLADSFEKSVNEYFMQKEMRAEYFKTLFPYKIEPGDEKVIHSAALEATAVVQPFFMELDDPYVMSEPTFDEILNFVEVQFAESLAEAIEDPEMIRGEDRFIFRINYRYKVGREWQYDVIPFGRLEVSGDDGLTVANELLSHAASESDLTTRTKFQKYLEKDIGDAAVEIVGFTLENLFSVQ